MMSSWIACSAIVGVLCATLIVLKILQRIDPGVRSPLPWIGHAVWKQLVSGRRSALQSRAAVLVEHPTVLSVNKDDLSRSPIIRVGGGKYAPVQNKQDAYLLLTTQKGRGEIMNPVWPLCCEGLTTLVGHHVSKESLGRFEADAGPLDHAFIAEELHEWATTDGEREQVMLLGFSQILADIRMEKHSGMGVNVFRCARCTHAFIASCGPPL